MVDSTWPFVLGMFHGGKYLLYPKLGTQLAQLLTGELCPIVGHQVSRDSKAAHYVLPYKVLYLVCSDLCDRFDFDPLCEVFNGYHEILHLMCCQRKMTQNVYSLCMEWPRAVNRPQLFCGCMVPICMPLALLTSMVIPSIVFLNCWPVVPSSDDF